MFELLKMLFLGNMILLTPAYVDISKEQPFIYKKNLSVINSGANIQIDITKSNIKNILSYLIEHNDLQNYDYYVSYREFRLIAACCVGKWDIAKEDIDYIPDDFIIYTKPVNKKITKKFLEESIKNKQKII